MHLTNGSSAPPPSSLVAFSSLPHVRRHSKVRFLARVHAYVPRTGILYMTPHMPGSPQRALIAVDVHHALEVLNVDLLALGSVLNVLGYISANERNNGKEEAVSARVQAIHIWGVGRSEAVALESYDSALAARRDALGLMHDVHAEDVRSRTG